ncbi:MAG: hypothetical protein QXQ18_02585 [Candidatus Aenigmatarchaeota archaeon]
MRDLIDILKEKNAADETIKNCARTGNELRFYFHLLVTKESIDQRRKNKLLNNLNNLLNSLDDLQRFSDKGSMYYQERIKNIKQARIELIKTKRYLTDNSENAIQNIWDNVVLINSLGFGVYIRGPLNDVLPDLAKHLFLKIWINYKKGEKIVMPKNSPRMQACFDHTLLFMLQKYKPFEDGIKNLKKEFPEERYKEGYMFYTYADGGELDYEGYGGYGSGFLNYKRTRKPLAKIIRDNQYTCRVKIILDSIQ